MKTRFRSVLFLFIGVALGILPIVAANVFMRDYAASEGRRQLEKSAIHTLVHAEQLVQEAVDVFSALPNYRVPVCNSALQDRFRVMILRHPRLHDVGVILNGKFMYCSSLQESVSFLPISNKFIGKVPHLKYSAVQDAETDKTGLLVQWDIQDNVSIGGFILSEAFDLGKIEFDNLYRVQIELPSAVTIAESSPESRARLRAPFANIEVQDEWSRDMIEVRETSDRYPISVYAAVPFNEVWESYSGALNIINSLGILTGGLVLIGFIRLGLKKPDVYSTIADGIRRREFIPYYQPIIDIQNGRLAGCEVLVRWRKPDGSVVSPGNFIDTAEATGLARDMTSLLMEQVAQDLSTSYARHRHLKAAINLFNRHFDDLAIVSEIEQVFGNSGINFKQLVFEITERQPLENLDRARAVIERMQRLGARVALDDAGTGHGGFAYLQTLGMDIIKIDKLFVDAITAQTETVPIVDSLRQMAKGMNMVVVAEGVETEEQLSYLKRTGVDEAQGYLFAPPLPASGYLKLVDAMGGKRIQASVGDEGLVPNRALTPLGA